MTAAPIPVTIVIPVKNEARNLPLCLAALPPAAELVVVDSGSTDATVELARAAGATVIDFKWDGRFPKKRNWVLQNHAFKSEWVLFLDADERLSPAFNLALARAVERRDVVGYWLHYNNHFMGRLLRYGVPQRKLALFRVDAGLYERIEENAWSTLDMEVHEHPVLNGAVADLPERIEHEDFRGLHHFIARHNEYSSWEARRVGALMADPDAWRHLTHRQRSKYANLTRWWFAPAYFAFTYVVRRGFLDGRAGLAYAALKFVYFFEIRLKILEARRSEQPS
jgi:glycosyltransferase involved in cell wall biosynthesis